MGQLLIIRKTKSIKLFLTRKLPRALKFSDILEISHQFCLLKNQRLRDPYSREAKGDIKALSLKLFLSYLELFLQLVSGIQFCSHGTSVWKNSRKLWLQNSGSKRTRYFSVLGSLRDVPSKICPLSERSKKKNRKSCGNLERNTVLSRLFQFFF
jgi:hypothetical protein